MDGFTGPSADRPVFVLAATNFEVGDDPGEDSRDSKTKIDEALVRRFSRKILVELPDRTAREQYLRLRFSGRASSQVSESGITLVAERSPGLSIAVLERVIEAAARDALRGDGTITDDLLMEALERETFGESRPHTPEEMLRTSRHEAGHAVLYWLAGHWASYVTVVSRGDYGGYMAPCADDSERKYRTREQYQWEIRRALAGRAAELLYYGRDDGLSSGAASDLRKATHTARRMVCEFGMDEEYGLLATPEIMRYVETLNSPVFTKVNAAASRILSEEMETTNRLLEETRSHLDAVSQALAKTERLTSEDLKTILPDARPSLIRQAQEAPS